MMFDSVPSAAVIADRNNFVYIYDPAKGFYSFDYYGSFKNRLPFLQWDNTAVSEKAVYGFSNNKLLSYQPLSLTLKEYALPLFLETTCLLKPLTTKYIYLNPTAYIYTR